MHNQQEQLRKALKKMNHEKVQKGHSRSQNLPMPHVPKGMLSMHSGYKAEKNSKLSETDTTDVTHYNLSYSQTTASSQPQIEHLDLSFFKVQPCKIQGNHSHKHCPFFHNAKDRKRVGNHYSAELCPYVEVSQPCPFGDQCPKAHNRVEQLYRNDNYKTKFCSFYPNNLHQCEYGKFCSFAHSETDIVIELIHNLEYDDDFFMFYYKTVWCPFNLTQHDKALCVYAHNWQDFRRKPHIYQYSPVHCSMWKTSEFITEYQSGCTEAFNCMKCHGWKELEYHPMLFRTKQCINSQCNKIDCSFYHNSSERRYITHTIYRQIDQLSQFRVFKIVPRNRIVQNTFKIRGSKGLQSRSQELGGQKVQSMMSSQSDHHWLGNNLQNSFQYDQDSDTADQKQNSNTANKKSSHYQTTLISIQERTGNNSDELRDIMRKKSLSWMDEKKLQEDQENEHVLTVLKMIDMDQ